MKPALSLMVLVSCLVWSMSVSAQRPVYKSGKDLHEALQRDGPEYSSALNYIVGVVDASNGAPARDGFCFDLGPQGVKASQVADVVRIFVAENTQMWDRPGSTLVAAALQEAWPCKQE